MVWTFHGTRVYANIDARLTAVLAAIGVNATSTAGKEAIKIGRDAARKAVTARSDDGINYYAP